FIILPQVRSLHPERDPYIYPQAQTPGHAVCSNDVTPMGTAELHALLADCRLVSAA
ncbi:MAG: hypothetical protein QOE98_1502, partial [Gaiellaceae bacterium]|nr:hypothetical protein [Gaiellaceae bacterium]